eukprot:scaffold183357_cov26-Tisochrysis_lutea.AAC.1
MINAYMYGQDKEDPDREAKAWGELDDLLKSLGDPYTHRVLPKCSPNKYRWRGYFWSPNVRIVNDIPVWAPHEEGGVSSLSLSSKKRRCAPHVFMSSLCTACFEHAQLQACTESSHSAAADAQQRTPALHCMLILHSAATLPSSRSPLTVSFKAWGCCWLWETSRMWKGT